MAAALNRDGLIQMIENVDEKHQDAHARLRADFRALEAEVNKGFQSLREGYMTNRAKIDEVEKMPVDAMKLMLTPRIVASIVVSALLMAGGIWASTSGLRSDMRDVLTRMDAQKTAVDTTAKMQELQANTLRNNIDELKRRQELFQYELTALKEVILTKSTKPQ